MSKMKIIKRTNKKKEKKGTKLLYNLLYPKKYSKNFRNYDFLPKCYILSQL